MRRHQRCGGFILGVSSLASCLLACSGTSSGNPSDGAGGGPDIPVPKGAQLVKSDLPREQNPVLSEDDAQTFAQGNQAFAFALYAELNKEHDAGDNLFFSPFSISTALAMTYPGAAGTTEQEMKTALHFELDAPALHAAFNATSSALSGRAGDVDPGLAGQGQGFALELVNQAWGRKGYPFAEPFLDVLAQNYGAGMLLVDFTDTEPTRMLINDWVAEQTNQRVEDLLPPMSITDNTLFVLTNAVYFKANWLFQFDPDKTEDGTFMAEDGGRTLPMMHQQLAAHYAEGDGYQAVELPYLSQDVRMLLILPQQGELDALIDGLPETVGALLPDMTDGLSSLSEHYVTLTLPRFSFESENKLKPALQALGMEQAFEETQADFSAINDAGLHNIWIDEVYHKAFVAVDEQGTEAAAATAVVGVDDSLPPPAEISFDHPFVFLIYDQPTGQILFLGDLRNPE